MEEGWGVGGTGEAGLGWTQNPGISEAVGEGWPW